MSLKTLILAAIILALPLATNAQIPNRGWEKLDEASAKAEAQALIPVLADHVTYGRRGFLQALPTGEYTGHLTQFELRPTASEYPDFCEYQIVSVRRDFVRESDLIPSLKDDWDLDDMQRMGNVKPADVYVEHFFLKLSPEPKSTKEQLAQCQSKPKKGPWIQSTHVAALKDEQTFLERIRRELWKPSNITLKCFRDWRYGCQVTQAMIVAALDGKRQGFQSMYLGTGTQWLEFTFGEPIKPGGISTRTSVIVELQEDKIKSITLAERTAVSPVP